MSKEWIEIIGKILVEVAGFIADQFKDEKGDKKDGCKRGSEKE